MKALGNRYIDEVKHDRYGFKMNEIEFLLNRLMRNVRVSLDNHKVIKKVKPNSSQMLPLSRRPQPFLLKI